jgi:hypothetical protein
MVNPKIPPGLNQEYKNPNFFVLTEIQMLSNFVVVNLSAAAKYKICPGLYSS